MPRYYKDRIYGAVDRKRIGHLSRLDSILRKAEEETDAIRKKGYDKAEHERVSSDMAKFLKITSSAQQRTKI